MNAYLPGLDSYIHSRETLKNDPNSLCVLLRKCEAIIEQIVEVHIKSIEKESGPHNLSSCVICNNKGNFDKLIDNKIYVSIPESATGLEDEEPEGPALSSSVHSETPYEVDEQLKGSANGSLDTSETSEKGGDDVASPEEIRSPDLNLHQHAKETKQKYQEHENFWDNSKKEIRENWRREHSKQRPLNAALTYYDKNKKIRYCFFEDDQQAASWAYKNVKGMEKHRPFIFIRQMSKLKSSSLTANDLAIWDVELIHPLDANIVIQEKALYDTGGDSGSFPYKPEIPKKFINSVTMINGILVPIVYAKLRVNGRKLNSIHEVELDWDEVACLGHPQVVEMQDRHLKKIMKGTTDVILRKKKNFREYLDFSRFFYLFWICSGFFPQMKFPGFFSPDFFSKFLSKCTSRILGLECPSNCPSIIFKQTYYGKFNEEFAWNFSDVKKIGN